MAPEAAKVIHQFQKKTYIGNNETLLFLRPAVVIDMLTASTTCVTFQVGASAPVSRSSRQPSGEPPVKAEECL
ncbi:hypothetical protein DAPPUDRAFT_239226 [Daphnia pulex]|uniref:Uncharacterized protein n=1 Tax=Daphnia pulex TaxID=6669 RepID=E9G8P3_DAPPU|nr:hypothetical protein DAPPUDRAFT_239226 [Daphnia pulex]|eukprot:EFX84233.1 hypothetical protein DAPPUDRAFT_239226 [Daphnia pulex]